MMSLGHLEDSGAVNLAGRRLTRLANVCAPRFSASDIGELPGEAKAESPEPNSKLGV